MTKSIINKVRKDCIISGLILYLVKKNIIKVEVMGKIFYVMGKSSSGKDTIYKRIAKDSRLDLKTIVLYTTRPIRSGEKNGVEYFFVNEEKLSELKSRGKVIESREYNTVHGIWKYFTVNDKQMELEKYDYLVMGTLESYENMKNYFGEKKVTPIYIEVDPGTRLLRAIKREQKQKEPKYEELCRRFLADEKDFSEEKLEVSGIKNKFINDDLEKCIEKIIFYIQKKR